jgi:O-antigen/teichoic acid export membrane protein
VHLLKSKFLRDTVTLQAGSLLTAVGNFASAAALAYLLGARQQGRYYVAISLYSLLWFLMNQGFVGATGSQVAAANARGLPLKVAAWLAFLAKAYLALGVVVVALGGLLLPRLAADVFHEPDGPGLWAFWLTLTPLLEMPRVVACAALQGTRRMLPLTQIENAQELSRIFLVVAGVLVTGSAAGAVLGMLAASALSSVIGIELYLLARREDPRSLPSFGEIARVAREVPLRAGMPLGVKLGLVRSIDALARDVLPVLLLRYFGSSEWVTYLRIAKSFLGMPLMFMQGASRTALPMLSELAGLKDLTRFRRTYWKASLYSGALISTGLLLAMLMVRPILRIAFPAGYWEPVWLICLILLPGYLIVSFSIANDTFYLVSNTLKAGVVLCVLGLAVCTATQTWLAARFPTTGAAWGLSFTLAITSMHFVYAAWWFRRRGPGGGAAGRIVPTAAGPS